MKIIEITGIGEVTLRKSARAKRLILKITPDGKPVVTVPSYVPYLVAERFVKQHRDWFLEHKASKPTLQLYEGKQVGKTHVLMFVKKDVAKVSSRIQGERIMVTYPVVADITDLAIQAEAKKAAIRALKKQAEASLPGLLHTLSNKYGYSYREVRIKTSQSRWGSCSNKKIINLSVWLMQLPNELVEYVLCHELTHLHHMHHQAAFWDELALMIPDYKTRRKALKAYSPALI